MYSMCRDYAEGITFLRLKVERMGVMTCLANQGVPLTEIINLNGRIAFTTAYAATDRKSALASCLCF